MPAALRIAALRYAELGYPVFPCLPGTKVPLTDHGFLDATVDPDVIDRWWAATPAANVAIATAGLVVVDDDDTDHTWPGDADRSADLAVAPLATTPAAAPTGGSASQRGRGGGARKNGWLPTSTPGPTADM